MALGVGGEEGPGSHTISRNESLVFNKIASTLHFQENGLWCIFTWEKCDLSLYWAVRVHLHLLSVTCTPTSGPWCSFGQNCSSEVDKGMLLWSEKLLLHGNSGKSLDKTGTSYYRE